MESIGYLFAAYTIIWLGLFGYLFYLNRKQRKLQKELNLLKKTMEE